MAKNNNLKDFLTDLADAIREKKGINEPINPQNFTDEIASIETGGDSSDDVIFYDYDGTILHTYSAKKFLALSEMPELPEQQGLICQEWNWNLEDAQNYVAQYGKCDIGATYITDDGKTRIYIEIDENTDKNVPILLTCKATGEIYIDWGDGTEIAATTLTSVGSNSYLSHTYNEIGRYCISIAVSQGCEITLGYETFNTNFTGDSRILSRNTKYKKIEIGHGIVISKYCFAYLPNLESISIPNTIIKLADRSFYNCLSIKHITVPKNADILQSYYFSGCSFLESVSLPTSIVEIGNYCFSECRMLKRIIFPNNVTKIGGYVLNSVSRLSCIIIPDSVVESAYEAIQPCDYLYVGSGIQSFASSDYGSGKNINKAVFHNNAHLNVQNSFNVQCCVYDFSDIEQLSQYLNKDPLGYVTEKHIYIGGNEVSHLEIPSTASTIPNRAFAGCVGLQEVTIRHSIGTIAYNSFENCLNLKKATILDAATISTSFGYCNSLETLTIGSMSIPSSMGYQLSHLKKVIFGAGVSEIKQNAFRNCYLLSEVYFNSNVTSIESQAFYYCNIRVIDFSHNTDVPTITSYNFISENYDNNFKIVVPDSLYDSWIVATNWATHASKIIKKSDWDAQNA